MSNYTISTVVEDAPRYGKGRIDQGAQTGIVAGDILTFQLVGGIYRESERVGSTYNSAYRQHS